MAIQNFDEWFEEEENGGWDPGIENSVEDYAPAEGGEEYVEYIPQGELPPPPGEEPQPQEMAPQEVEGPHSVDEWIIDYQMQNNENYVPPVEYFDPRAPENETPENVTDSQEELGQINYASQEYADEMTQRIINDYNGYMTDENYQGMLNKQYTVDTYNYIKRANNDAEDPSSWSRPNPENPLYSEWLPTWIASQDQERQARARLAEETPTAETQIVQNAYENLGTDAQREIMDARNIEHGNWNLLSTWDKIKYLVVPGSNASPMDDTPDWAKYIQNIYPSFMAGAGGAMVGGLLGPVGSAIGGLTIGGLTYLQGVTDIDIPVINGLLETLDLPAVWLEQAQGAAGALGQEVYKRAMEDGTTDLMELGKTAGELLRELPDLFEVSQVAYEVGADLGLDNFANLIRNVGAKASNELFGTDFEQTTTDTISRANLGIGGTIEVNSDTRGYDALYNVYLPIYRALRDEAMNQGMSENDAKQFAMMNITDYTLNYMGTNGLVNDFTAQSIFDPTNLVPYVTGKATEGIGKITGDVQLQNAGRAAVGNPFIDMLPAPAQQFAEMVTGKHGSQGLNTITETYKQGLRSQRDVTTLSSWQRRFAGINSDGTISNLNPNTHTGNTARDYLANLFKTTDETKMFDISQMTTDFLGSILFDENIRPEMVPTLVEQVIGTVPIDDASPLARFRNSAMLNTLQESFKGVDPLTVETLKNDVINYRRYNLNRQMVDYVAQKLGITVDQVFDALDNKDYDPKSPVSKLLSESQRETAADAQRQRLYEQIRTEVGDYKDADGNVYTPDQVIKKIDVFRQGTADNDGKTRNPGRRIYSMTRLKADLMTSIADAVDRHNLQRFNIQPDHWAVRTANLAKSMQSIALLNFSSSYAVNNFLNNLLTRSVEGIGGIDTDFIRDVNSRRGIGEFTRNTESFENTGKKVKNVKKADDILQKFDDLYNNVADKAILKGVNNIDIEGMETKAAWDIATRRYWDSTWGSNIPEMPPEFKALGITDDMAKEVRRAALDSANITEFKQKLMGDVILPKASSTFAEMLTNYDSDTGKVIADYFSKYPWMSDLVDGFMESGDPEVIRKGFADLRERLSSDINLKNVIEMGSTFESLRTRYANEGFGAVATAFEALNDLYSQVWMDQTKQSGNLFFDRVVRSIDDETFQGRYDTLMKNLDGDYKIVRGYAIMNMAAMIEGLGINSEIGATLLAATMQQFDISSEYIRTEHELYQKYAKKNSPDYDMEYYKKSKLDALKKTLDAQTKASESMHKAFIDYMRTHLDDSWTGDIDRLEQSFADVIKLKQADNAKEIEEATRRIDTDYKRPRMEESLTQEKPRQNRKREIHYAYEQIARQIKGFEGAMDPELLGTKMAPTLEHTMNAEFIYEEAKGKTKQAGEFLKKYKDGVDTSKPFEPTDYRNKNVQGSFFEYGQERLRNEATANGLNPRTADAEFVLKYYDGTAVPLGTVDAVHDTRRAYDPQTGEMHNLVVTDHFELLKPKQNLKTSEYVIARCQPYAYGNDIVTAGVYHNGKLIAYITEGMQEKVTVRSNTYPIFGKSITDPSGYVVMVQDKPRTFTPGKPNGVEFTAYADQNFHPGAIGSTPDVEPWGRAALESSMPIRDALNRWEEQSIYDLQKARQNGSFFSRLNPDQQAAVLAWTDQNLTQAYNAQRYMTKRYGETMVDATLLNYNNRYGFDNTLTMLMPYQYWLTRSVANWGKRMIAMPAWYSMYSRLQKLIEKNKKDFLPTRLEGLGGLLMPNMGDGMGDSYFIDIGNTLFPFQQFYNATEYFEKSLNTIHRNTMTQIDEMYDSGTMFHGAPITDEMYEEAKKGRGELYREIFEKQRSSDESDTSMMGLMQTFMSPPVWFDMVSKHMRGRDKDISYSPMFRLGNTVKATGDNTAFEDVTDLVGSALQGPESAIRKLMGIDINPDGNYADYGIVSNIAQMVTTHEISKRDAMKAIAEGAGNEIYDMALSRYRQAQAYRQQGGALMTEIGQSLGGNKDTSLGQIAGSGLASMFGAKIFSQGELQHREDQALLRQIMNIPDEEERKKARREFYKTHPDYRLYSYSYEDDPDKRLHKVLVDMLSDSYYALPESQQIAVQKSLGTMFTEMFVNPDTRATDYIDNDTLIEWTAAMQGSTPNFSDEALNRPARMAEEVTWYADSVQADYDRFVRDRDKKFPGIKTVEEGYYKVPASMRDKYLEKNPMLAEYRDWKDKAFRANPRLATYLNDRSAVYSVSNGEYDSITEALMGKLSGATLTRLQNYIDNGWAIPAWAERNLKKTYNGLMTQVPYETWLRSIAK